MIRATMYPRDGSEVYLGAFPDVAACVAECLRRGLRRIDIVSIVTPVDTETGQPVPIADIIAELLKTEVSR